jgi:hypothetical protein
MTARRGASSSWRRPPLLPISAVRARPHALLIIALLAALAVPGAAFGQSAGDEQYSDPFAGEDQQQQQNQQPPQQEQQPAPQPAAPAEPVEQPAAPAPSDSSAEAAAAPAQSSDPSLPVTGLPALTLLALGAGMLASGLLVRRRA